MAHTRTVACESYICEGNCKKGREGTFWKKCQKCDGYRPVAGGRPIRVDNRRKKLEKARNKDLRMD